MHILVTTAGVVVTIQAGRLGAAWMVKRGGRWATVGKVIGAALSFPATPTVAA